MSMGSFDGGLCGHFDEQIKLSIAGISADDSPKKKMDALLQTSREKGMSADKIFSYFDKNNDGNISAEEFKNGLYQLNPLLFDLKTDQEIQTVVDMFDKDGDGSVSTEEFKTYCYNLPGIAWKAERLRASRASRSSMGDVAPILENSTHREGGEASKETAITATAASVEVSPVAASPSPPTVAVS